MRSSIGLTIAAVLLTCLAAPKAVASSPRPVVMWHGLGDSYNSGGMQRVESLIKDMYPDIFVHSIYLDEDPEKDSKASLFGKLDEQVWISETAARERNFDADM